MKKDKKKERIIELIRCFYSLPILCMFTLISVIIPPAIITFYFSDYFVVTKESILMLVVSSTFSLELFIFLILFLDFYHKGKTIDERKPQKTIIQEYLEGDD